MEFGVQLENFPMCREIIIPPGTEDYKVKLRLYDNKNSLLELWVHIKAGIGGSVLVRMYTYYLCVFNTFIQLYPW